MKPRIRLLCRLLLVTSLAGATMGRASDDVSYRGVLLQLCEAMLRTQIVDETSPDHGALKCPSVNPQLHPLHSRAGEAVYPLAIAFNQTGDTRFRDAAIKLGNWLARIQQPGGAWGESAPNHDGWTGTTADQLISLAGAYPVLREAMSVEERRAWEAAIFRSAEFVAAKFPMGNINYQPTGAVALLLAGQVLPERDAEWRAKAKELIAVTLADVNRDGFIVGEGQGVDLGYNLAQSIGYLALYGLLAPDDAVRERALEMLRVHAAFVYPNGSIDNSWGTRSYKWTYESGTKTAPGVYFSFELLADLAPEFAAVSAQCLDFLARHSLRDGLVVMGPHYARHGSTNPPCLYSTFARAQSIAMAMEFARPRPIDRGAESRRSEAPALQFFPTVNVAVVRTRELMATISAYDGFVRYGRAQVGRGGSISNLWIRDFGALGFVTTSSVTDYRREEAIHMPNEPSLAPLTPRVECEIGGTRFSNLYAENLAMTAREEDGEIVVVTRGPLTASDGSVAPIEFTLTHRFRDGAVRKIYALQGSVAANVRIVEPFVQHADLRLEPSGPGAMALRFRNGAAWTLRASSSGAPIPLRVAEETALFWNPFPAVECTPVVTDVKLLPNQARSVELSLERVRQ